MTDRCLTWTELDTEGKMVAIQQAQAETINLSASDIAEWLSGLLGCVITRNAIIGFCNRHDIFLQGARMSGVARKPRTKDSYRQAAIKGHKHKAIKNYRRKSTKSVYRINQDFSGAIKSIPQITYDSPSDGGVLLCRSWGHKDEPEVSLGQCRWPIGGDKYALMVCGKPTLATYCDYHQQIGTVIYTRGRLSDKGLGLKSRVKF